MLVSSIHSGCTTIFGAYPSSFNVIGKPVEKNSDVSFFDMARYHINQHLTRDELPPVELLHIQQEYAEKTRSYYGPESKEYAGRMADLSETNGILGNRVEQLRYAKKAYDIALISLGKDNVRFAWECNRLAAAYYDIGDDEQSLYYALKASEIPKGNSSDDQLSRASTYGLLAIIYDNDEEYDKAIQYQKKSLEINEEEEGKSSRGALTSRSNIADSYLAAGEYDASLAILQEGLDVMKGETGHSLDDIKSRYLFLMGKVYAEKGDIVNAINKTKESISVSRESFIKDPVILADSLIQAAILSDQLGDSKRYFSWIKEAASYVQSGLPKVSRRYAYYSGHLARAYAESGNYFRAKAINDELIDVYRMDKGDPVELARAYLFNSSLQLLMGDESGAQFSSSMAVETIETFNLREPDLIYNSLMQRAVLRVAARKLGGKKNEDENSAARSDSQSLIISALSLVYASKNSIDHEVYRSHVRESLRALALVSSIPEISISLLKKIVNSHQAQKEIILTLGEEYINSFVDSVSLDYFMLSSLLTQQGRDAEALQVLNMLKQHEFFGYIRRTDKAALSTVEYSNDESDFIYDLERIQKKIEITTALVNSLEIKQLASPDPGDKVKLDLALQEHEKLTSRLSEILKTPPRRSSRTKSEIKPKIDSSIANAISSSKNKAAHITYWISDNKIEKRLNIIISDSKRQDSLRIPITDEQKILLESLFPTIVADVARDPRVFSKVVYDLMVSPIEDRLKRDGVKNLIISLNGPLRYIPFSALYDGNNYLIEKFDISIYNNLVSNRLTDQDAPEWKAMAVGVTKSIGSFPALPGVRDEVESIIKNQRTNGVLPGEIYLDNDFTRATLFDSTAKGYEALHIASHFVFSPGTEANSYLLLGDGTQLSLGDLRLQNIDLSGFDLVTLSACETGAGGGISGDGKEIDGSLPFCVERFIG